MKQRAEIEVFLTPTFSRIIKKLKDNQKEDLNRAIKKIVSNPQIGQRKKGLLSDVWVFKFKMIKQVNLLAYTLEKKRLILLSLGVHENFYRDISKRK